MAINYSFSQLDYFQKCQKQYMYEYVQKEERRFVQATFAGSIVHKFLESLWGIPWEDALQQVIEKYGMYDKISEISQHLKNVVTPDFFKNTIDCEVRINFDVNGKGFIGVIDRLDRKDQTFEIVDYKYGNYEYTQYNLTNSLQVDLYSHAIINQYHVDAVYFTYHNIMQNTKFTRFVKKDSINVNNIVALTNAIESARERMYFPPQVSNMCAYCFFNQKCDDFKQWLATELKITPQSSMDEIIDVLINFSNKRKAYEAGEKKLKNFLHDYLIANGLREYNNNNKHLILSKNSVLVKNTDGSW